MCKLYYQNVRGLRSKTSAVFLNSQNLPYDIFALKEINLTPEILSSELFTNNYTTYRKDSNSHGRRVLLAIHNTFESSLINAPNSVLFEGVSAKISLPKSSLLVLCCDIRPAQQIKAYEDTLTAVDFSLDQAQPNDMILVLGDLNLPNLIWSISDDQSSFLPSNIT